MNLKKLKLFILPLLSILLLVFIYNDDFLYKEKILKITNIETIEEEEYQNYIGYKENHFYKKITGVITNTKDKGKILTLNYEETESSVITDKLKVRDKIFIKNNDIDGFKRDFYIALVLLIFINLIYLIGSYKGLLSVVSVVINFIIFYLGLKLYFNGINILFLCIIESFIFSILSLFISNGINKKTLSASLSVVTMIFILIIMLLIIVNVTKYDGVNFNELKFLTVPPEDILLPELLIGGMGAIMDVAITISSSINELIEKDKNISIKNLNKSSKQIGKDIMSTMTNVLFFTYLSAGLPIYVLAIRNGFSVYNFITTNFSLELTRFLVGSIGIVLTIPITTFISIKIFKRGDKFE